MAQKEELKTSPPTCRRHPWKGEDLGKDAALKLDTVRHFVLDECDKMLEQLDMRSDVQEIFKLTPHDKQVMMFSATLSKDIRRLQEVHERPHGGVR